MEKPTPEEMRKRHEESVRQATASFPNERMEVAGNEALATWENLRATRRGSSPVVVEEHAFHGRVRQLHRLPRQMAEQTREARAQEFL
jgi:hypothetical protein